MKRSAANGASSLVWFCADGRLDGFLAFLREAHGVERPYPLRPFGDIHDLVHGSPAREGFFREQVETGLHLGVTRLAIGAHTDCRHRRKHHIGHPNDLAGVCADLEQAQRIILGWGLSLEELLAFALPVHGDQMDEPVRVHPQTIGFPERELQLVS